MAPCPVPGAAACGDSAGTQRLCAALRGSRAGAVCFKRRSAALHMDTGSASWLCLGRTGRVRREVSKQNPTKRSVRSAQLGLHGILGSTASQSYHKKAPSKGRAAQAGTNTPPLSRRPCPGLSLSAGGPGCAQHPLPAARPRGPHSRALPGSGLRPAARAGPLPAERRCPRSRQPGQWPRAAPPPAARRSRSRARARPRPAPPAAPPLPSPRPPPAAPAAPRPRRRPARRARAPALASREPAAVRGPPGAAACGRPLVGGGGTREGGGGSGGGRSFPDSWRLRRWLLLRGSPLEARDPRAPPY